MATDNLYKRLRALVSPYYRYCEMRIKIVWYNLHRNSIIRSVRGKSRIRVAFFVVNLSMWKCESLFRLMMDNPRFDPVLVPMPRPMFNKEAEKQEQMRLIEYCRQNYFPCIPGYDYTTGRFNGYDEIRPDVVFFGQPYNAAYPEHKIERFWKKSIFYYVPYCIYVEQDVSLVNTLYINICQSVFLENNILKEVLSGITVNRGRNFVVTGYIDAPRLQIKEESDCLLWKKPNSDRKRVIWAPHHSIREIDILNYSVFLEIADDMLELARQYRDKVQFAFKPHPGLKPKLYDMDGWGKERTDRYYSEWENMPNSILAEGSYDGLFRSSDALIHDCSSFTVEYLYTGKPALYLTKEDHLDFMNKLGSLCFGVHYKGRTIDDIRNFIEDVVLGGQDTMNESRQRFVSDNLAVADSKPAEQIILDSISSLLSE